MLMYLNGHAGVKNQFCILHCYLILLTIFFVFGCSTKETKIDNHCKLILNPNLFDSLYLHLENNYIRLIDSPMDNHFHGKIKSIKEIENKKEVRYDEDFETPLTSRNFTFDKNGNLTEAEYSEISSKSIIKSSSYEYDNNQLLKMEKSLTNQGIYIKSMITFFYTSKGLLSEKKYFAVFNEEIPIPEKPFLICKNAYDSNGLLTKIKEIHFEGFGKKDSTITKFSYDNEKRIDNIVLYDKYGKRVKYIAISYIEQKNLIQIDSYYVRDYDGFGNFGNGALDHQIILLFDGNCHLQEVTDVTDVSFLNRAKYEKEFTKIKLNIFGDITMITKFKLASLKDNGFRFIENEDYSKIKYEKYTNIEYVYDNFGNWIEKRENNLITRRKISY